MEVNHPVYETIPEYANGGCPVKIVRNCTKEVIHAAVTRVPHESALADEAIVHFSAGAKGKVASKQARMVLYNEIKFDITK